MAPFRPANLNKRLVSATGGNGGVIGTTQRPYANGSLNLGCRCCGGCCTGRFSISESFCGVKECCACSETDCKGFFICCGPSTNKWFVAPSCTEVGRNWYSRADAVTVANSCMGSCGWFVPTSGQLQNPGYSCRTYWDSYSSTNYWSSTEYDGGGGCSVSIDGGGAGRSYKNFVLCVRTFRCTAS